MGEIERLGDDAVTRIRRELAARKTGPWLDDDSIRAVLEADEAVSAADARAVDALRELAEAGSAYLPIRSISLEAERFRRAMVAAGDLLRGQQAVAAIGQLAEDCPHPAWDHETETCVACGAAPTRAVVERDQEITDLQAQLASAVHENEQLRAEVERLNGLLVAQGESWKQKLAAAEQRARPCTRRGQPVLSEIEPA